MGSTYIIRSSCNSFFVKINMDTIAGISIIASESFKLSHKKFAEKVLSFWQRYETTLMKIVAFSEKWPL